MNLEAVYFISQVVAAVALVGSLVFVGIQIRQVSKAQRREAKRVRETVVNDAMSRMSDDAFGPLYVRGSQGDPTLSDAEIARYHIFANSMLILTRSRFEEFREGILPEADWQKLRGNIRFWLASPGFRATYMLSQVTSRRNPDFDAEFAEALSEPIVDRHEYIARAWRSNLERVTRVAEADEADIGEASSGPETDAG